MKYAIVSLQGKQHKVTEGEQIQVDRLEQVEADKFTSDQVLLLVDGDKIEVGQPLVGGASIEFRVVENLRGEKIRVAKYKSKSRYRKVRGHRQSLTSLEVVSIKAKKTSK